VADVIPIGRGQYRVIDGTRQRTAYAAGPPEARWVFLDGRVYVIDVRSGTDVARTGPAGTREGGRTPDEDLALSAPMPATVAAINVAPGQLVEPGDLLIVLEAMKMELPVRAPRAGRVKAVACRPGELVQPGIPLVELE